MSIALFELAPIETEYLFDQDNAPNSCSFVFQYVEPDEFGNDKIYRMESWALEKATYKKINWARFSQNNFPKVARNIVMDSKFTALANSESFAASMQMREDH